VSGVTEPNVTSGTVAVPAGTQLGTWTFELQQQGAPDFQSLNRNQISDVILIIGFTAS
jgi:hypothetical protein